ncbi:MAG: hypothetical protein JRD89_10085 [Deltaproteobacteria bacterium]|nr:hypothetical protein [Deltaproteobacteria bacterium]
MPGVVKRWVESLALVKQEYLMELALTASRGIFLNTSESHKKGKKVLKYIKKNLIQILIAIAILGILAVVITTVLLD